MNINLGEKFKQEQCCKCGLNWVIAKEQKIGVRRNGYTCPWCSRKEREKCINHIGK